MITRNVNVKRHVSYGAFDIRRQRDFFRVSTVENQK